jgi:hypothetical protein
MSNSTLALQSSNAAIRRISNGKTRGVAANEDIKTTAARNTASVDNSVQISNEIEEESKASEKNIIWYAFGISLGLCLLVVVALKYKIIKI